MLDIRVLRGSSGELYRRIALFPSRSRDRCARGARAPFPISGGNRAYFVMELVSVTTNKRVLYEQRTVNPLHTGGSKSEELKTNFLIYNSCT